jgi:hypothetical protein
MSLLRLKGGLGMLVLQTWVEALSPRLTAVLHYDAFDCQCYAEVLNMPLSSDQKIPLALHPTTKSPA